MRLCLSNKLIADTLYVVALHYMRLMLVAKIVHQSEICGFLNVHDVSCTKSCSADLLGSPKKSPLKIG